MHLCQPYLEKNYEFPSYTLFSSPLFLHSFLYVTKPKRVCAKKSETYHNGHYSGMSEIISEG